METSEIKKIAKAKLKEKFILSASSTLLFLLIILVIGFVERLIVNSINQVAIATILQALFFAISWVLSYSIIHNLLALADEKTNSITNFINLAILNFTNYIKLALRILLKCLIPIVVMFLTLIYMFGTMLAKAKHVNYLIFSKDFLPGAVAIFFISLIVVVYFLLKYILSIYIYYKDDKKPIKEIVDESKNLMKGHILEYVLLVLSFVGWFLLAILIMYVLQFFVNPKYVSIVLIATYSFIKPYVTISTQTFYENLGELEAPKKESKTNSKAKTKKENK